MMTSTSQVAGRCRRQCYKDYQWEALHSEIAELYLRQRKTMTEIVEILANRQGFIVE